MSEVEIEILRRMTPQQKVRTGTSLYFLARRLKLAGLERKYPGMSDAELKRKLNEAFLYARD